MQRGRPEVHSSSQLLRVGGREEVKYEGRKRRKVANDDEERYKAYSKQFGLLKAYSPGSCFFKYQVRRGWP